MPRTTRRRTPLDKDQVLRVALRMADKGGIESLSMRRIARALRVEAMSLYNHFAGKEEILDGLVELVVGEIDVPTPGRPWRAEMRRRALSAHEVLMRHPWATMLFVSRPNTGPQTLRYVDATIGTLRAAGFSWPMADHAWNALDAYVYGFTFHKLNFPFEPADYARAAKAYLPLISRADFPHVVGLAEEVIAGRHDGINHIELGLDLLLDGLETLRGRDD